MKKCNHDWRILTLQDSDFKCAKCSKLGKQVKRHNPKTGTDEYVIRALPGR